MSTMTSAWVLVYAGVVVDRRDQEPPRELVRDSASHLPIDPQPPRSDGWIEAPGWVYAGHLHDAQTGEFSAPVAAPVIPARIAMRQARLALLAAGKYAAVTAAINALPEPQRTAAQITWEYSTEVQRNNGLVAQLGPALGLSEAQIDALFISAAAL